MIQNDVKGILTYISQKLLDVNNYKDLLKKLPNDNKYDYRSIYFLGTNYCFIIEKNISLLYVRYN